MKKVKFTGYAVVKSDEELNYLLEYFKKGFESIGCSKLGSGIDATIIQNTENKYCIFKAGQIYKIKTSANDKYLILISVGTVYIKAIICSNEELNKLNSLDIESEEFFKLIIELKLRYCYYRYNKDKIQCNLNQYRYIYNSMDESIHHMDDMFDLNLEYIEMIDDNLLSILMI